MVISRVLGQVHIYMLRVIDLDCGFFEGLSPLCFSRCFLFALLCPCNGQVNGPVGLSALLIFRPMPDGLRILLRHPFLSATIRYDVQDKSRRK